MFFYTPRLSGTLTGLNGSLKTPCLSRTLPGSLLQWFTHLLRFARIHSDFQSMLVVSYRLQFNKKYLNMLRSFKTISGFRPFYFKYSFRFSGTLHGFSTALIHCTARSSENELFHNLRCQDFAWF